MPYTFGGAAGDDITWTAVETLMGTGRVTIVTGWWRPTTLTATRYLWSAGNLAGAEIDTTTSQVRMRTDHTTDGQWTAPVGLAVNEWKFLAFACASTSTGPAVSWRVWAGSIDSAPVEIAVTQAVAPVGNITGNVNFYIGNRGTGSLAFQGQIADVTAMVSAAGAGISHPFGVNNTGAIDNTEAQWIFETFVRPLWLGDISKAFTISSDNTRAMYHNGLDWGAHPIGLWTASATIMPIVPTINGATWSQEGAPRPYAGMEMLPRRRR